MWDDKLNVFHISLHCAAFQTIRAWGSYQIRKIAGCACAGNAGNVFPGRRFKRKPLVSDPGMHHGTCVTHVPWCMSGSLTCGDEENVPGIPGTCAPAILRIWQEAHVYVLIYGLVCVIPLDMDSYWHVLFPNVVNVLPTAPIPLWQNIGHIYRVWHQINVHAMKLWSQYFVTSNSNTS